MNYSIIIPHHNDTERLVRLLRSIPLVRQDIEVIVIDDCSTDQKSLEIVRNAWPKVRWLSTQENSGAGQARNIGLDSASGFWLVFADSDDEFIEGAFDIFDQVLRKEDQLVYFLADAVNEINGSSSVRAERINKLAKDYAVSKNSRSLERLRLQHVVPWSKIYSREFIEVNEIRFDTVRRSNDVAFNVIAALSASKIRVEPLEVYRVYCRLGSLTMDNSAKCLMERLAVICQVNDRLRNLHINERMHAASYLARSIKLGPHVLGRVLWLMIRHEMCFATIRQLNPLEVWRFIKWYRHNQSEKIKLKGGEKN